MLIQTNNSAMFIEKGQSIINRELNKKVVRLIHQLLVNDESVLFRKPVAHKALGLDDYKTIVKKPVDLNLIRRNNNEGKYKFVEEVLDEIQLCWDNCKAYNHIESDIYKQAIKMEHIFDQYGQELLPEMWLDIDRQQIQERALQQKLKEEVEKAKPKKQLKPVYHKPKEEERKHKYEAPQELPRQSQQHEEVLPVQRSEAMIEEPISQQPDHINDIEVEPIIVNLFEKPSIAQLKDLSEQMERLFQREEYESLSKVVEILHTHQKEALHSSSKNQLNFNMSQIHINTYHRIQNVLGIKNPVDLIE